jgi:hypothetical protein
MVRFKFVYTRAAEVSTKALRLKLKIIAAYCFCWKKTLAGGESLLVVNFRVARTIWCTWNSCVIRWQPRMDILGWRTNVRRWHIYWTFRRIPWWENLNWKRHDTAVHGKARACTRNKVSIFLCVCVLQAKLAEKKRCFKRCRGRWPFALFAFGEGFLNPDGTADLNKQAGESCPLSALVWCTVRGYFIYLGPV